MSVLLLDRGARFRFHALSHSQVHKQRRSRPESEEQGEKNGDVYLDA